MRFGIDVSHWQNNFDFNRAKRENKIEFAIIKAGGGDGKTGGLYKDSKFERNYREAKAAGLLVGAYFFGKALTVEKAEQEAKYFLELVKGKGFDLPLYYDVEADMVVKLSKTQLTKIVKVFCDIVEKAGYYVGIYCSESYIKNKLDLTKLNYTIWCAKYSSKEPSVKYDCWQFGGEVNKLRSNKINGITVDQNYFYNEKIIEYIAKKNNKKSNEEIAQEVLQNKWGTGTDRKNRLTAAGYDYRTIQKIVNEIIARRY